MSRTLTQPSEPHAELYKAWIAGHSGAIFKVARAYTRTAEDCQDLAQEILLQAWLSLPKFAERASPATWFYRVALNTALSWNRDERRRQSRQVPLLEFEDVCSQAPDSADALAHRELVEKLYAAIHQLPKPEVALVLLYLDGLSYRHMAEVLGITESNVGVKLNRAKKSLSELMIAASTSSKCAVSQ